MKKISVSLILLLAGVLAITSFGCDIYSMNRISYNGWVEDADTGDRVRLGVRLQLLERYERPVDWIVAKAEGNIHLVDNSQKVTVQASSNLKGGKEESANIECWDRDAPYFLSEYQIVAYDCKLNGVKGHSLKINCKYTEATLYYRVYIQVKDAGGNTVYYREWIWENLEDATLDGWLRIDDLRIRFPIQLDDLE